MRIQTIVLAAGVGALVFIAYRMTQTRSSGVTGMERRPLRLNDPGSPPVLADTGGIKPTRPVDPVLIGPPDGELGPPVDYWQGDLVNDAHLASGLPDTIIEDSGTNVSTGVTPFQRRPLQWLNNAS